MQYIQFDNRSASTLNWYYETSNQGVRSTQKGVLYAGQQILKPVPPGIESVGWLTSGGFTGQAFWASYTNYYAFSVYASRANFLAEAASFRASLGDADAGEEIAEVAAAPTAQWQNNSKNNVQRSSSAGGMMEAMGPYSSIEIPLPGNPEWDAYGWIVSGFSGRLLRQLTTTNVNYQWTLDNNTK